MKSVVQLDINGYFVGMTTADESPLEPGIYLMPANTIDAVEPIIPEGHLARWDGQWIFELRIISNDDLEQTPEELTYSEKRSMEYPPIADYLDGVVKGDQVQIDKYIADCLAVKAKYQKPE